MSGDMFNNPDAEAAPDTHVSQTSDNKIPDSSDDARVLACWGPGQSAHAGYWGCCMAPLDQAAAG